MFAANPPPRTAPDKNASTTHNAALTYRPDIDGLRAVAVLAVLIFHASPSLLPGGFVGVDVFFVISGYLIAAIIRREVNEGRFSLVRFYERRVRRIFPALFLVVAVSTALGALILTPIDYEDYGRSVIATLAFYSNFHFNQQAGYFAPAADVQALLHMWSLGVEEQFYLVAPFVLLWLSRRSFRTAWVVFSMLFAASLTVSVWGVAQEEQWAFYLPHARAFELMCGVALAMGWIPPLASARQRERVAVLGLVLLLGSLLWYSAATPFPGIAALAPAVGAAMLIHSSTPVSSTRIAAVLSVRPVVFVGKISYSLYLWHWPLLVFGHYYWGDALTSSGRAALLAMAVGLATLTYHYIEQPARRSTSFLTRKRVFALGSGVIAVAAVTSHFIVSSQGFPGRLSPEVAALARTTQTKRQLDDLCGFVADGKRESRASECVLGARNALHPTFILWGDSHAATLATTFGRAAKAEGAKGYNIGRGGCVPFYGLEAYGRRFAKCVEGSTELDRMLDANPEIREVILAARWALYAEGEASVNEGGTRPRRFVERDTVSNREAFARQLKFTVARLRAAGKSVTLIGPVPELDFNAPAVLMRKAMRGVHGDITLPRAAFDERQQTVLPVLADLARQPGVRVTFPHETLCRAQGCVVVENDVSLYVDDDHLSLAGTQRLEPALRQLFRAPQR